MDTYLDKYLKSKQNCECVGGIIINPWDTRDISDYHRYKFHVVKQCGGKWGFPKGHIETEDTTLYDTAIREISEETGYSFNHLIEGNDYKLLSFDDNSTNILYIKNIAFYVFVLLKPENELKKTLIDTKEICDSKWANISYIQK